MLLTNHTWPRTSTSDSKESEELEKIQKSTSQMIKGLEKGFGERLQLFGFFFNFAKEETLINKKKSRGRSFPLFHNGKKLGSLIEIESGEIQNR